EAVETLVEKACDCLVGRVAPGDAGAAVQDDDLGEPLVGQPAKEPGDLERIIADDAIANHLVPSAFDELARGMTRKIIRLGTRVGDGHHEAAHASRSVRLVLMHAHGFLMVSSTASRR